MRSESRRILFAWIALLLLLALTCGSSWLPLGAWNGAINGAIAVAKAALVALVFMHLAASAAIRACVGVALFVLALIFALGGSDYATRDRQPAEWQLPAGGSPGAGDRDGVVR